MERLGEIILYMLHYNWFYYTNRLLNPTQMPAKYALIFNGEAVLSRR